MSICKGFYAAQACRRDIHEIQNDNFLPLIYTLEVEIDMLDFDPRYPKDPQTFGEKLRKARMDRRMTLEEVAVLLGVSDTSVLNWEIRGKIPDNSRMERVKEFLEGNPNSEIS